MWPANHNLHSQARFHSILHLLRCLSITLSSSYVAYSVCQYHNVSLCPAAVPISCSPCTVIPHQTFTRYCFEKLLCLHLRRCRGSNNFAVFWYWNLMKDPFPEASNFFLALTLLAPMLHTLATITSPALWQASRTSIKKAAKISPLVLPWIK